MDNYSIAQAIRDCREDRDIRSKEMAEALGHTPSKYSKLENGEQVITAVELYKICKVLNVKMDDLLKIAYKFNVE